MPITSRVLILVLAQLLSAAVAAAQAPISPKFEVAAIKVAVPLETQLTTGQLRVSQVITDDRIDLKPFSLADLIVMAYGIKDYQLTAPDWMRSERYEVQATLPAGSTKAQVPEMMQALLADRFQLKIHREKKTHGVYALVVGSDGHKLQPAEPDPAPDAPPPPGSRTVNVAGQEMRIVEDGSGGGTVTTGQGSVRVSSNANVMRLELPKATMTQYAALLSQMVDKPVIDFTNLTGSYQAAIEIGQDDLMAMMRTMAARSGLSLPNVAGLAADASQPTVQGSSVFAAVQKLGLKLEPRNIPLDDIVVDSAMKTPTEN